MHRTALHRSLVLAPALLLFTASCGGGNAPSGDGGPSLAIASPEDGASVSEPFMLTFDASVPLGDTSTGNDHVHVCFDGASCDAGNYEIAYGDSFQVAGLPAGEHTVEASLRHADHSAAGPTDTITVTITGAGGETGGTSSSSGGRGYG